MGIVKFAFFLYNYILFLPFLITDFLNLEYIVIDVSVFVIWEKHMDGKEGPDGTKPAITKKRRGKKVDHSFSEYVAKRVPRGAVIDYIFFEDFDGDGEKEAVIGYTQFSPFPPESSVIFIKRQQTGYTHLILTDDRDIDFSEYGIFDQASAADTDGDGVPELVISLAVGSEHYITLLVFDWLEGIPRLTLRTEESFYHGSLEVSDHDEDGIYEMVVESSSMEGNEILELDEACFHVRESCCYKWDGQNYVKWPYQVRMPYQSYNMAVEFLMTLWKQEYKRAYKMVRMPAIMGLDGLDDSSLPAFKRYIERNIRPVLVRNLLKKKLVPAEPYDAYCMFYGDEADITVELVKEKSLLKVQSLNVYKKGKP